MSSVEARPLWKNLTIVVMIAIVSFSLVFWLIESWMKYIFFVYGILTAVVVFLVIGGYEISLKSEIRAEKLNLQLLADLIAICIPSAMALTRAYNFQLEPIRALFAILCTSFIPGYALLRITTANKYFSKLEILVLSYLLSYVYTGTASLVMLPIEANTRSYVLLLSYIILSVATLMKDAKARAHKGIMPLRQTSLCRQIDILAFLVVLGFYAFSFMAIYPELALLPRMDISRHYASSIVLGRTPELYVGSTYLLSHLHESAFLNISKLSLPVAQTSLVMLNFILPIAFYVAAKRLLQKVDRRIPSLAMLFWTLFSNGLGGFAWIYFASLKLSEVGVEQFQLLVNTADKTIWGTQYAFLGLWYVPAFVSLMIFLTLLSMMPNRSIPRKAFLVLFSTFFASLLLTHVAEASLLALFLVLYWLLSRTKLRVKESLVSMVVGYLIVLVVYLYMSQITVRFSLGITLLLSFVVPFGSISFAMLFKRLYKPISTKRFAKFFHISISGKLTLSFTVVSVVIYLYLFALFFSGSFIESFHTYQISSVVFIPWLMYPLILGVNGILGLLALYFILGKDRQFYSLALSLLVFSFVAARIITVVNSNFFRTGFPEDRFIWLIKIPLALLAPIPLLRLSSSKFKGKNLAKIAAVASLIGIVVVSGVSTTFLNVEYWKLGVSARTPSQSELDAVKSLTTIFDKDPRAWLATFTHTSEAIATLAAPSDILVLNQLLSTAKTPEMLFSLLYRHPAYSHPYIYVANRDVQSMTHSGAEDSFLRTYLETLPIAFSNSEVKIYNASKPSFPQENSDIVLVLPYDSDTGSQELLVPYYILSRELCDYTVSYDIEKRALNSPITVMNFDPFNGTLISQEFADYFGSGVEYWTVSKGVWKSENETLIGGSIEETSGVTLAPLSSPPLKYPNVENFTAAFTVKPLEGDPFRCLFVGLVYSWRDSQHYRMVEVYFDPYGHVYGYFRVVEDTEWDLGYTIPKWPGVRTGKKWNFGDKISINVTVEGALNELYIDGEKVLSANITNVKGRVGLAYARFIRVAFDDFMVTARTELGLRPADDYVDYLNNGGTLIVLNTYGYYSFADRLFQMDDENAISSLISGVNFDVSLPTNLTVGSFSPKSNNTEIVSWYITADGKVPYIARENVGKGKLVYVNIYPIVEFLKTPDMAFSLYLSLNSLVGELDLPRLDPEANVACAEYVREISLNRNVSITTQSLLFPMTTNLKVNAKANGESFDFDHVTGIRVENLFPLSLEAENTVMKSGKGLFATFEMNSTFLVFSPDQNIILKINTDNEEFTLTNISEVTITPNVESIQILVKNPEVHASEAIFHELYSFGNLYTKTGVYGQDLEVSGNVKFFIPTSDTYTVLQDLVVTGSWRLNPPLVTIDEAASRNALLLALLTVPVFLVWWMVATNALRQQKRAKMKKKQTKQT